MRRGVPRETLRERRERRLQDNKKEREREERCSEMERMPRSRSGLPMNAREPRISLFPITAGPADGKRPTASRPHEEQNARLVA